MQHIGVSIIDEEGKVLQKSEINFVDIVLYLSQNELRKSEYPWLWGIDPYGNTIFNMYQIPHLSEELKKVLVTIQDSNLEKSIQSSLQFFESLDHHEYLKFTGD